VVSRGSARIRSRSWCGDDGSTNALSPLFVTSTKRRAHEFYKEKFLKRQDPTISHRKTLRRKRVVAESVLFACGAYFFPTHIRYAFCQGRWQVKTLASHTTPVRNLL
jgi:hypothetical protein